ncbi:MAG: hypothetical protein MZV64_30540 [Ignavibacteriales bacterium]|nr:hypothetical protein [Ignavibacteriales bacterium]
MEKSLSLDEEIDLIMKKKLSGCDCNPCTCPEQTKGVYYQELKDILERYNEETLNFNLIQGNFLNKEL